MGLAVKMTTSIICLPVHRAGKCDSLPHKRKKNAGILCFSFCDFSLLAKKGGVAAAQEIQASSAAYGRGVTASVRIFAFCVVRARNNFPSPGA